MKPQVSNLRAGQLVWGVIEEVIAQNEIIINFTGDLLRVQNQTNKKFRPGQRVQLRVEALFPLQMKLLEPQAQKSEYFRSLDVNV